MPLAVDRMSDAQLWKVLKGELVVLDPVNHPINAVERARRRGAYMNAWEIVRELETRGVQLQLPPSG